MLCFEKTICINMSYILFTTFISNTHWRSPLSLGSIFYTMTWWFRVLPHDLDVLTVSWSVHSTQLWLPAPARLFLRTSLGFLPVALPAELRAPRVGGWEANVGFAPAGGTLLSGSVLRPGSIIVFITKNRKRQSNSVIPLQLILHTHNKRPICFHMHFHI